MRKFETEGEGVLIIDDTIDRKPYTDTLENKIICCHFSHECITAMYLYQFR
ncbi:MAG: hypothetical protein P0S93_04610 [Candidatus Neptunochlamydia sp.]|nr:hypothetical protein [Candidatus Neptunochlamydia sp.]